MEKEENSKHTNYYKRYITKNGKKIGPYYYTNKKVDGKVVSTYLGTKKPTDIKLSKSHFQIKNLKPIIIIASVIMLALIIFLFQSLDVFSTGNLIKAPDSTSFIRSVGGEFDADFGDNANDPLNDTNSTYVQEPYSVIKEINTVQGEAILGEPVLWEKEVVLSQPGSARVEIPVDAKNIKVYRIDENGQREEIPAQDFSVTARATTEIVLDGEESSLSKFFKKIIGFFTGKAITIEEGQNINEVIITDNSLVYEIEYETSAAFILEEETGQGKTLVLSSPESIVYEDVITFTELDENLNIQDPEKVIILWVEGNSYITPKKVEDMNHNGIYDYVEFIAPNSDGQTFTIIVITRAEHLDENKTFVRDIYEQVRELDDVFSEEIPDQHYVRITFERNLTSDKDITIFPKILRGTPKIEIYEKDKNVLIAEFTNIVDNEYNKVFLTNLEGEQDTFDLRIVGSSVFFDHIIDPPYAEATAGLIVYGQGTVTTPRYSIWNTSNFQVEQSAPDLGTGSRIEWVKVKSSTTRNETAVGILDDDGDILFNVRNDTTGAWGSWLDVANIGTQLDADRGFDVEVEEISGDFVVAYERDTASDSNIYYRVWNGSSWSGENTITLDGSVAAEAQSFIALRRKPNSDSMIVASAGRGGDDLSVSIWDGNSWGNTHSPTLSLANINQERFAVAWESLSGDAIVAFGSGTNAEYVFWSSSSQLWSLPQVIRDRGATVEQITLCSDPTSDYIGVILGPDSSSDTLAVMWNGNSWLSGEPGEDTSTERITTQNAWCSFQKNSTVALFGYVDTNALSFRYFTYDRTTNSWECPQNSQTVTSLNNVAGSNGPCNTGNVMTDDIEVLRFFKDPNSNDIMILAMDALEDLEMFIFNGTQVVQPANALLEQTTSTVAPTSPADFDYSRVGQEITIPNSPPQVTSVQQPLSDFPSEGGTRIVTFNISVLDLDGQGDITNVKANFTKAGESVREDTNCVYISGTTYQCSISMMYYDASGSWNISVFAQDSTSATGSNNTGIFSYGLLNALTIVQPSGALAWSTLTTGQSNASSINDPSTINNTGNFAGQISVTGLDLVGETTLLEKITASNFTVGSSSGAECTATPLQNTIPTTIAGSTLPRGQNSLEYIYFCIPLVPSVSSQTYSAQGANAWTIKIV